MNLGLSKDGTERREILQGALILINNITQKACAIIVITCTEETLLQLSVSILIN